MQAQTKKYKVAMKAGLDVMIAVTEAIREAGSIPSGTLYAVLCGSMDITTYEHLIRMLTNTGLVTERNHMLTWTGPTISQPPLPASPLAVSGGRGATRP